MKPSRWKANEPDATAVIRRFLDGDDDSLAALWNRVKAGSTMQAKRLLRHAGVSASQFDEDDAANSVLFRIHQARRRGKLDWVKSNEDFRRLFSVVLRRVVLDARRRLNASRRAGTGQAMPDEKIGRMRYLSNGGGKARTLPKKFGHRSAQLARAVQ